jgi:hypothetical protein
MRQAVALPKAYRLLNHGPTMLVSAAHAGPRNVMSAAWATPLAAPADERVFSNGRWHVGAQHDSLRTLHTLSGGAFIVAGDTVQGQVLPG